MWEVARSRNLLSGFVTTLKRLFESVVGTLFSLLLYSINSSEHFATSEYSSMPQNFCMTISNYNTKPIYGIVQFLF